MPKATSPASPPRPERGASERGAPARTRRRRCSPAEDAPARAQRAEDTLTGPVEPVVVGRVVGAWGVRGWIRVAPFNDSRDSILPGLRHWWLQDGETTRALQIDESRVHGAEIVAKAAGIDDRDAAAALEGRAVLVARADFPSASDDEVYWVDLIGCTVRNPAGEVLGVVQRIEDHSAHPVLRVSEEPQAGERRSDRLIPLVPAIVLSIDVAARDIVADWQRDY